MADVIQESRNELMAQIRRTMSQHLNSNGRRQILSEIQRVEQKLIEAMDRSQKLALKRFVKDLEHSEYKHYAHKDEKMQDCSICLVSFQESDQIVVFQCDLKHYFHAKCGFEWLQVKPQCPLCRTEFKESISKYINQSVDKSTKNKKTPHFSAITGKQLVGENNS